MSIILEVMQKRNQKLQEASRNTTAGEGAKPRKKAWRTVAGRETQQAEVPDVPAGANEQGGPGLLRSCHIDAAPLALLVLLAGALLATNVWLWLRPASVTTDLNMLTYTAKPERILVRLEIDDGSLGQADDVVNSEVAPGRAERWQLPSKISNP